MSAWPGASRRCTSVTCRTASSGRRGIPEMLSLIFKTIQRNGRRSLLAVLGIAVSVFLVCCLIALTNGFHTLVQASSENNVLATYEKKRACPWTSKLDEHYCDTIRGMSHVEDVTTELIIAAHYGEAGQYAN